MFLWLFISFVDATVDILLLLFLYVLIAVGIRGASDWISQRTPFWKRLAVGLTAILITVMIVVAALTISPSLIQQLTQLNSILEAPLQQIGQELQRYGWGQQLMERLLTTSELLNQIVGRSSTIFTRVTGIISSVLSLLSTIVIVFFVTLFLALEPETYVSNFLHLIPKERRQRVRETLGEVNHTLKQWILTRVVSMVEVGILSFIGLQLLGTPLVLSLAIIAAIGAFIPTFGPVLALIPAVMVALIHSPGDAVFVLILYLLIQMIDNYLVTPILQKSILYLPPVYSLAAQLFFGVLAGAFRLVLGAPIAAALVVVVRILYVEDVLHDDIEANPSA